MAKAPPASDDTVEDDPVNVSGEAPSLDQVHAVSQAHVEQEDEDAAEEEDQDGDGDSDADDSTDGDADGEEDGDSDGDSDVEDDAGQGTGSSDDEGTGEDSSTDTPPANKVEPAPKLDTDTTKNGEGKVAIKDADGTTFYFNNLDEVPDDFEPASYKALMVGTKALFEKDQSDKAAAVEAEAETTRKAHQEATEQMQESWEADVTVLVRSGQMPNEPKKLEAAKNEVYDYIESELKKGNVITSFNQAYKSMKFDQQQEANKGKQKDINDAKKKRGSIVQGGSGGDAADNKTSKQGNKVIEAPPQGAGLDAVHAHAISQL